MTAPGQGGQTPQISGTLSGQIVQNTKVHLNLDQDAIVITEDKLRLCLMTHLGRLEQRRGWIAPLGIFVTILITLATTKFQYFVFEAAVWKAIFVIGAIASFLWLVRAAVIALRAPNIDDVVNEMKRVGGTASAHS